MIDQNTTNTIMRFLGIISFAIAIIIGLLFISSLIGILPASIQELPTLVPFYLWPIGIASGGISYIFTKNRLAGWGIVLNCLFSFSPILLMLL